MTHRPATHNPQPSVELHIDEMILHGFAPGGRDRLGDAVQQELTRLLNEHGLPSALSPFREIERLHGGTFPHSMESNSKATCSQVMRPVRRGIKS